MAQPQITLNDYSPVSVVVRTVPEDFLKPYAGVLSDPSLTGKWNTGLKGPGGSGRVPGWIFPKKNEALLRTTLNGILTGQIPPTPSERQLRYAPTSPSMATPSPATPMAPSLLASTQPTYTVQTTPSGLPSVRKGPELGSALLPAGAPAGYQQIMITVIKPEPGQTLNLTAEGQVVPMTVVRQIDDRQFVVRLSDGQESIIALETAWKVPGYTQAHEITRP